MYSQLCCTTLCHFSGNFIILSSFLSFWAKNCSRRSLQSSRKLKFFPLREFCKNQNKWTFEGVMSDEYGGWIRTSSQAVIVFAWASKKYVVLHYHLRFVHFLLTNFRPFSLSAACSWSNWQQYLLELIVWFFRSSS